MVDVYTFQMAETDVVEGVPAAAEEEQEPVSNEVDVLSGEQAEQLENGNKRLREEAADEQEGDEPSAKRAVTSTEENVSITRSIFAPHCVWMLLIHSPMLRLPGQQPRGSSGC